MYDSTSRPLARRKPMAACVASFFALAAPLSCVAINVTDCGDSGAGTLRGIIATAGNGSTVDASACSTITLSTGAIAVTQNSLTINGPVAGRTTITAIGSLVKDRIFTHTGNLNFTLNRLDIEYGRAYDGSLSNPGPGVNGGCIASSGNVFLTDSIVSHCSANSLHGRVYGGGVFASKVVWATRSTIMDNLATSLTAATYGGGVFSSGEFIAKYSTISDNVACPNAGCAGAGGGVDTRGGASIGNSTISGNAARSGAGGARLKSFSASPPTATITNSTISGNRAVTGATGGVYSNSPITVSNSTIAFNIAGTGSRASGLDIRAQYASITATLNSALLSNNSYGTTPTESDFSASAAGAFSIGVSGANNLIVTRTGSVPANGLVTSCALLGPLRNNGGTTWTHQLLSGSPAIDVGNDTSTATGPHYDQRGSGYPRSDGTVPDIGAYELRQSDAVFNNGFDGCP